MELIQLRRVSKVFRKRSILNNVNITIEEGDLFGIIGVSGSGKTTLLNLITGFLEPSFGNVFFYSKVTEKPEDLNKNLMKIKRNIGFTPQHNSFYPKLTVKENLWHFGGLYGIKKKILKDNIENLLKVTHLFEHQNKMAEELSGGMQKRLDISCSLVHKPKILILDEPTADLDPLLQTEMTNLLQGVNKQGITIIFASHHFDSIENICNKVAIVHNGKVQDTGLIDDVIEPHIKDHFTINIRTGNNKVNIIERLKTFPVRKIIDRGNSLVVYPKNVHKMIEQLINFIQEENLQLREMDLRKPSLYEIFEKVVSKDSEEATA